MKLNLIRKKTIKSNVSKSELKNLNDKITNFISIELKELEQKINELEKFVKSSKEIVKNVKEEMEKLKNELLNEFSFNKNKIENVFQSKEKIIMDLKLNPLLLKEKEKEKMISVFFSSFEEDIQYSVICKSNENFSKVESLLYDRYPEYKNLTKEFFANGKLVDVDKNLEDNYIENNCLITLNLKNS